MILLATNILLSNILAIDISVNYFFCTQQSLPQISKTSSKLDFNSKKSNLQA